MSEKLSGILFLANACKNLVFIKNLVSQTPTILAFWRHYLRLEKILDPLRSDDNIYMSRRKGSVNFFAVCAVIYVCRQPQYKIKPVITL